MCQSLQIDDIISKLKTEELILGLLKADQERNVWIMLKEMTQSKQVAARQLQTEPGLTLGYQNNGGHIYFVFRLLLLMLSDSTQLMYNISVSIQYEKENHFCERMQADRHSEYEASVYK